MSASTRTARSAATKASDKKVLTPAERRAARLAAAAKGEPIPAATANGPKTTRRASTGAAKAAPKSAAKKTTAAKPATAKKATARKATVAKVPPATPVRANAKRDSLAAKIVKMRDVDGMSWTAIGEKVDLTGSQLRRLYVRGDGETVGTRGAR